MRKNKAKKQKNKKHTRQKRRTPTAPPSTLPGVALVVPSPSPISPQQKTQRDAYHPEKCRQQCRNRCPLEQPRGRSESLLAAHVDAPCQVHDTPRGEVELEKGGPSVNAVQESKPLWRSMPRCRRREGELLSDLQKRGRSYSSSGPR